MGGLNHQNNIFVTGFCIKRTKRQSTEGVVNHFAFHKISSNKVGLTRGLLHAHLVLYCLKRESETEKEKRDLWIELEKN